MSKTQKKPVFPPFFRCLNAKDGVGVLSEAIVFLFYRQPVDISGLAGGMLLSGESGENHPFAE